MLKLKFTVVCLLLAFVVRAQFSHPDFDSVLLQRSAEVKNTYNMETPLFRSLSVSVKGATMNYTRTGSILGDVADEFMGSLLKNFGSGTTVNISFPAMIKSDPEGYGWNIGLFVGGPGDQNSAAIPQSSMYWQNGAIGHLIDDKGQMASFGYSVNAYMNKKLKEAYESLKRKQDSLGSSQPAMPAFTRQMQVVFGDFKGVNMVILSDYDTKLTHIYLNGKLEGVYTDDRLVYDGAMFVTKKQKRPFVLWFRKGITDLQKADMIRMTLFSKYVFSYH